MVLIARLWIIRESQTQTNDFRSQIRKNPGNLRNTLTGVLGYFRMKEIQHKQRKIRYGERDAGKRPSSSAARSGSASGSRSGSGSGNRSSPVDPAPDPAPDLGSRLGWRPCPWQLEVWPALPCLSPYSFFNFFNFFNFLNFFKSPTASNPL